MVGNCVLVFAVASVLAAGVTATHVETGVQSQARKTVVLTTGDSLELSFTVQAGQVAESIVVTSAAPLLETHTPGATQLIEAQTIEDLPLSGRRALNVMELQGASALVGAGSRPFFTWAAAAGEAGTSRWMAVRRGRADPPVETLKKVRALTNGFPAEYRGSASRASGRHPGRLGLAVGVRFELTVAFRQRRFSRPLP